MWKSICGLLKEPERLRAFLDARIEQDRESTQETRLSLDKLAEVDRKRVHYQ